MKTLRITAITMVGVLVSAALGAGFLGAFTYLTTQPNESWFGPNSWKVAALGGAVYAAAPGLIVGGAVSLSECGKASGTLIGSGLVTTLVYAFSFARADFVFLCGFNELLTKARLAPGEF